MYAYRISGTVSYPDEGPGDDAYQAAQERYSAHLESLDLSGAGDLLLYFGYDFFHDAGIDSLTLAGDGRDLHLDMTAWIDSDDDPDDELPASIGFQVRFHDTFWSELLRERPGQGFDEFLYSEIDGLSARIGQAVEAHGGEFHSLTVECVGAWLAIVFRRVTVVPQDPILWARVMRDPRANLCLYGVGASS